MMYRVNHLFHYFSIQKFNSAKDYYRILNINNTADQKEIKKAFRQLAKKYHPDSNKGKQQQFKEVNEAYQVLSDQTIKRDYDEQRRSNSSGSNRNYNSQQQSPHQNYGKTYSQYNQAPESNYRGYSKQTGWKNMSYRDQFMYDLYRQQQAQFIKKFHESQSQRFNSRYAQQLHHRQQKNRQKIKRYSDDMKKKQQEYRRTYEQEQRQKQKEFRQYNDQTYKDINDKFKQNLNKMAQGVAQNVKGAMKMGEYVKDLWNSFTKKK